MPRRKHCRRQSAHPGHDSIAAMASAMMSRCNCPPLTAARPQLTRSAAQWSASARTLSPASPAHRRQSCSRPVVTQAAAAEGELEAQPEKLRLAELWDCGGC